jgi:hypothetical protein
MQTIQRTDRSSGDDLDYERMVSSGMLRRVALVRTYVSEEPSAYFIRVTRIGELGTTLVTASVVPSSQTLSP